MTKCTMVTIAVLVLAAWAPASSLAQADVDRLSSENLRDVTVPEATVPLEDFGTPVEARLTPDSLYIDGAMCLDSFCEQKNLYLPPGVTPAKGDILICFDLTGSMWEELANVQNNSINIMNAVRALIPDTYFGVISHMDYPGDHGGCDYGVRAYGDGGDPYYDYAYSMDQALTGDLNAVETAVNGLPQGNGADGPESYTRALYESYADGAIGWRPGAKRIILQWGDNIPHDCAYDECIGGATTSGPDPGRDEIDENADDLEILAVLDALGVGQITLLALHSGTYLTLWDCYAGRTGAGGTAFEINPDGTIPGGVDIADYIASIIGETIEHIDLMTLEVCTPGYEAWLTNVVPPSYADILLDVEHNLPFTITLTVPDGTGMGVHEFDICAMGDGAEYARQHVTIVVPQASATEEKTWGKMKRDFH